eukprot:5273016-Pleurochrysis_carterae.AAC.1
MSLLFQKQRKTATNSLRGSMSFNQCCARYPAIHTESTDVLMPLHLDVADVDRAHEHLSSLAGFHGR